MCGICGTAGFGGIDLLRAMAEGLAHRGPDGEGLYARDGVFLANRRLAIVDIANGAQPFFNEDRSIAAVYNGEIYNFPELRAELISRGHEMRTRCDTEILPHLYEDEGIEFARRLNGIFAFAIHDARRGILWLARDPIGVKPLHYAEVGGGLAFGSELKALLAIPSLSREIDPIAVHFSLNLRYIPGERTILRDVRRVPAGCALRRDSRGIEIRRYAESAWSPDPRPTEDEWAEEIRETLRRAVKRQLMGDVEIGITLSGGIDSSGLVALVRQVSGARLKTFTLGFDEPTDELADARRVARAFDTDHRELVLPFRGLERLPRAIACVEEPKVNGLQGNYLFEFVGREVKAALSGLGGDELFAGYDIYRHLARSGRLRVIAPLARAARILMRPFGSLKLDIVRRGLDWIASIDDPAWHYLLLRNAWERDATLAARIYTPEFAARLDRSLSPLFEPYFAGGIDLCDGARRAEFATKMVDDFLLNEDRNSMAFGVESRVPYLDLEVVDLARRIPIEILLRGGLKGLMKKALAPLLPAEVLAKRKWGFTFNPVEQFRKDLRDMAAEVLTAARIREGGVVRQEYVRRIIESRPSPSLRWHYFFLWQLVGLELTRDWIRDAPAFRAVDGSAYESSTSTVKSIG